MSKKFDEMTKNQKCLLVGKVAKLYDQDKCVEEIAEILGEDEELIWEVWQIIEMARNPEKEMDALDQVYPWGCGE